MANKKLSTAMAKNAVVRGCCPRPPKRRKLGARPLTRSRETTPRTPRQQEVEAKVASLEQRIAQAERERDEAVDARIKEVQRVRARQMVPARFAARAD